MNTERMLIGKILLNPAHILTVLDKITPQMLHGNESVIYGAMVDIYKQAGKIDAVSITRKIQATNKNWATFAIDRDAFTAYVIESTSAKETGVEEIAADIQEKFIYETIGNVCKNGMNQAAQMKIPAGELLGRIQSALGKAGASLAQDAEHIAEPVLRLLNKYEDIRQGKRQAGLFKCGFVDIDNQMLFGRSELVVLAARRKAGKSRLALQFSASAIKQGCSVFFSSMEMSAEDDVEIIAQMESGVNALDVLRVSLSPQGRKDFEKKLSDIQTWKYYFNDSFDVTVESLNYQIAKQKMQHGCDVVIVDYFQLLSFDEKTSREANWKRMGDNSRALKRLAKQHDVCLIVTSQLNKDGDNAQSKILENDADKVLKIKRENETGDFTAVADVEIITRRGISTSGMTCKQLRFDAERAMFCNYDKVHDDLKLLDVKTQSGF